MSGPIEIITRIRLAGGSVLVEDGDLSISAPAGTLNDQDRAVLAQYKDTLVEALAPPDPEREAIQRIDAGDQQQILNQAIGEWDQITGIEPVVDEDHALDKLAERLFGSADPVHISTVIREVFASLGIEVEIQSDDDPDPKPIETPAPTVHQSPGSQCDRCGSREYVDVVLHDHDHRGRSVRRECAQCQRHIGFPLWYGVVRIPPSEN